MILAKEVDEALIVAQKIIEDKEYLPLTKSYAKLIWLSYKLDSKELSDEDKAKLQEYFDSYKSDTAFYGSAHLLEALWYKKTDKEKAKNILQKLISSKSVTNTLKEEARALMSNLTIEN